MRAPAALRRLARRPGHAVVAVAALALGIGLSGAMFAVLQGSFLRGLPFPGAERIVHLARRPLAEGGVLAAELAAWREAAIGLEQVAGFVGTAGVWSGDGAPAEHRNGGYVSAGLFAVAGVAPALGRAFRPDDELPGAERVVVLSDALWRQRYGADPELLGRSVRIGGEPATIVGVMPPGFQFPLRQEFWLPLEPVLASVGARTRLKLQVVARLREGASPERLEAALDAVAGRVVPDGGRIRTTVTPFLAAYTADARGPLWLATAAVVGVLLIACANVANLLLARGVARSQELAVRAALGAGRRRIAGELLGEAAALSCLGGAAGLAVAWAAIRIYRAGGGLVESFWVDVRLDLPSLLVVAAATGITALVAGSVPAARASRLDPARVLAECRGPVGLRLGRLAKGLVASQVAFSCALLVGTGLLIESVRQLHGHDFGAEPERVWTGEVSPAAAISDSAEWQRFYDAVRRRVEALPGVEAAAWTSHLPSGRTPQFEVEVEGAPTGPGREGASVKLSVVAPGYFETLGRPILRGRDFGSQDRPGGEEVLLVDRAFADRFLGGEAVGRRLRFLRPDAPPGPWRRVVGVAPGLLLDWDDFEERIASGPAAGVYRPLAQSPQPAATLVVRSSLEPEALTPGIREAVAELDPGVPVLRVQTLAESITKTASRDLALRRLLAAATGIALALAAFGLFGVVAFAVDDRTRELGIRSALGAGRAELAAVVARTGAAPLGLGLLAGLALAAVLARALQSLLFGVEPWEPRVFLGAAAVLAAVAVAACFAPLRRAARLDPAEVLRGESTPPLTAARRSRPRGGLRPGGRRPDPRARRRRRR